MKLNVDFSALEAALKLLGAQKSTWSPGKIKLEGGEDLLREVKPAPDGALTRGGKPVLLYIKDTGQDRYTLEHDLDKAKKFHIAECTTLKQMRAGGRYERYVVTDDVSGSFEVTWENRETGQTGEIEAQLKVCRKCLIRLNWCNYGGAGKKRQDIWQAFNLADFLRGHSPEFDTLPLRFDFSPPDEYPPDWPAISKRIRERANWTCNKCRVRLDKNRKLLDTHHKNGVKSDTSRKNLVALCKICHAQQQFHGHYRSHGVRDEDRRTIERLRREQGL